MYLSKFVCEYRQDSCRNVEVGSVQWGCLCHEGVAGNESFEGFVHGTGDWEYGLGSSCEGKMLGVEVRNGGVGWMGLCMEGQRRVDGSDMDDHSHNDQSHHGRCHNGLAHVHEHKMVFLVESHEIDGYDTRWDEKNCVMDDRVHYHDCRWFPAL